MQASYVLSPSVNGNWQGTFGFADPVSFVVLHELQMKRKFIFEKKIILSFTKYKEVIVRHGIVATIVVRQILMKTKICRSGHAFLCLVTDYYEPS